MTMRQTDMCQDPPPQKKTASPGFWRILDNIFSFPREILEILDPVTATMLWDLRDLESQTQKMLLDPGNPGSCWGTLLQDPADLGSCTAVMLMHLEDPLIQ